VLTLLVHLHRNWGTHLVSCVCVAAGVGITRDGLATLFREYVQGTEDEMCKPRTRGGTGLGLSICSKQVREEQQEQLGGGLQVECMACN
jgi:signal transduction histidine kinase